MTRAGTITTGTLIKTGGTGISTLGGIGFSNTGTVEVDAGILSLPDVPQFSGSTLAGGTWNVLNGSALSVAAGSIATNDASVTLGGAGASFAQIDGLAVNNGSFGVIGGASSRPPGTWRTTAL